MVGWLDSGSRILTGLSPLLLVAGLLALAAWRGERALARTARQTRLADALAEAVGPIVAPVVTRRFRTWRIAIPVPFGRPAVVARVLAVVDRTLRRLGSDRYEIVLTPQEAAPPAGMPGRRRGAA
jgi:hypothetical protein